MNDPQRPPQTVAPVLPGARRRVTPPAATAGDSEAAALRLLLALTLSDREAAAMLVRGTGIEADGLWPSVVVARLADAFITEPACRRELGVVLDRRLAPWLTDLSACSLCDLLARLPRDDTNLDIAALAALLWSLVRRRHPAVVALLARVVHEAERLILADAGRRSCRDGLR